MCCCQDAGHLPSKGSELEDLTSVKETAEEWIARVREALKGGSQSTVDDLRALLSEAKHIPVLMHERALLEAEVDARSWAIKCGKMLESRARADAVRASLKELQKIKHTLPAAQRKVGGMVPYAARWGVSCSLVACVCTALAGVGRADGGYGSEGCGGLDQVRQASLRQAPACASP